MGFIADLATIDSQRIAQKDAEEEASIARTNERNARRAVDDLMNNIRDGYIRDWNANGFGSVFAAGFLDAVPAGEQKQFVRNHPTTDQVISFTYDKDTDVVSDVRYTNVSTDEASL